MIIQTYKIHRFRIITFIGIQTYQHGINTFTDMDLDGLSASWKPCISDNHPHWTPGGSSLNTPNSYLSNPLKQKQHPQWTSMQRALLMQFLDALTILNTTVRGALPEWSCDGLSFNRNVHTKCSTCSRYI